MYLPKPCSMRTRTSLNHSQGSRRMLSRPGRWRVGAGSLLLLAGLLIGATAFAQPATTTPLFPANYVVGWGDNTFGELGDGHATSSPNFCCTFAKVENGFTGYTSVSTGRAHTVALSADGSVWAWGEGCGADDPTFDGLPRPTPTKVPGLPPGTYTEVAAGGDEGNLYNDFSLALRSDGTVWQWGVCSGTTSVAATEATFPTGTVVTGISAGDGHALAMTSTGAVYAWALGPDGGFNGQLGNGCAQSAICSVTTPELVSGLSNVIAVSAGDQFSLALTSTGKVYGWGDDQFGESSGVEGSDILTPTQLPRLANVIAISAGDGRLGDGGGPHALALEKNGTVWAWGDDTYGEIGNGTTTTSGVPTPTQVAGLSGITSIAAGQDFSMAASGATVWAWGRNNQGQLGEFGTTSPTTTPQTSPVLAFQDPLNMPVTAIDAGGPFAEIIADPYEWFAPPPDPVLTLVQGGQKDMIVGGVPSSATNPLVSVMASPPFSQATLETIETSGPNGQSGGPLPPGTPCSANCGIGVTLKVGNTAPIGSSDCHITVTYSDGSKSKWSLTVQVQPSTPLVITTAALANATIGQAYSSKLLAVGGNPPYTWTLAPGSSLPKGLKLSAKSGAITGTPTRTSATQTFTVEVTDTAVGTPPTQNTAMATFTLTVLPATGSG